jgi:RNA polymerase subunit RPABC4/transcription elongation factor Spt4
MKTDIREQRFQFGEEARLVPGWAFVLAALVFAGVQVLLYALFQRESNPPSLLFSIPFGVLIGFLTVFFVLLIGYVNVDSGRRGMNRALWTAVVIFVPNAIGFVLYFLLRQPLHLGCPRCGAVIRPGFNYCPSCSNALHPACPKCKSAVSDADAFCPYCGTNLALHNHSETRL